MKKLTFKVSSQKNYSIASLIKNINNISCRIYLDFEKGFISVENVNDDIIDTIIDLVNQYYAILSVDIDNTFEKSAKQNIISDIKEVINESIAEHQTTALDSDLVVDKFNFQSEYINNSLTALLKTVSRVLNTNSVVVESDIGQYILSCKSEISMNYFPENIVQFSNGDIVDVNFGTHLLGEISGGHVSAIVCNVANSKMVYVVPITQRLPNTSSKNYFTMNVPQDATYFNKNCKSGTVLLSKGRYVRVERFNSVIGKTNPDFFKKILSQLASTFDFTNSLQKTAVATSSSEKHLEKTVTKYSDVEKTIGKSETALLEFFSPLFDKLDKSKPVEEQISNFMAEIGMPANSKLLEQAFVIACTIKKINYENIILALHALNPNIKENIIKVSLKEAFKNWLKQYPILAENNPRLSLTSVLKVFAKKFS